MCRRHRRLVTFVAGSAVTGARLGSGRFGVINSRSIFAGTIDVAAGAAIGASVGNGATGAVNDCSILPISAVGTGAANGASFGSVSLRGT